METVQQCVGCGSRLSRFFLCLHVQFCNPRLTPLCGDCGLTAVAGLPVLLAVSLNTVLWLYVWDRTHAA